MGAVLDTVYNNYLSTYTPKEITRYDTHKKSELRGVYNSIVKLNKESPWYLPTTNKDTQKYAVDLKENARDLHNTIAQLGGLEEDGLFKKKSAYSSDADVATAKFIGTSSEQASEMELTVHSLATPQENLGEFLSNRKVTLPADTYSFDISINDMNYEFQFSIDSDETNRQVQNRLVRLINNADIGIKATILEDSEKAALKLTSDSTGLPSDKEDIFRITDNRTSMRSGTVKYFGLDYVAKEAENARYSIDGEEYSSNENQFQTDSYEVKLHGVNRPGESTRIGLKTDIESIADNINQLVNGYNDFIRVATGYSDSQSRSRKLVSEMRDIARYYHNSMESMGLDMKEDGTLSLDSSLLHSTAESSEDISETFKCFKDFSKALLRKSNQISLNPMDYVEKTVVAYKNPGHNFNSPYTSSAYSGMMFNFFC